MRTNSKNLQVDFIKNTITPLDFYKYELPCANLKRYGWKDGGLCPFHNDRKPGSFRVNLNTGAFKCFACGASGGDIIAFTMERYGLTFIDALQKLADEWGVYQ
jgi:DNA primase